MLATPLTAAIPAMTTATAMAAYQGGKQPYYPSPAVTLTFPMAPGTAALSSTYMCGGGCGGGGGGTMTLTHPPPTINNYYLDSTLDPLYREDGIISPKNSHNEQQTLDGQLSSSPPPSAATVEENHHHRSRIGSVDEASLSPIQASSPPTQLLSPHSSTSQFPPATTSALNSSFQPHQPFQHKPATFHLTTMANGLPSMANGLSVMKNEIPSNGFPRLTQHHFPQTTFSHIPSTLNGFAQPYSSFPPPVPHTTLPNVVVYPKHHNPPLPPDYPSATAAFNGIWNQYSNNIHTPKLSYDSPRYKLTPERATPLQKWFDEHRDHPYPTRHDKIVLCQETNLTFTQVSTWFANCRRRMKKASQEDEERPVCNGSSSGSLSNGTSGKGSTSSVYQDEDSSHTQRLGSQSPNDDSPCSSGRHDTEEKIHTYGEISGLPERFSPFEYDRNGGKQGGIVVSVNNH